MTEVTTAPEKAPKAPKDEKNGVVRPAAGTATGNVWAIADHLSTQSGEPATRKDVLAACETDGINKSTATTQYGRWRKYNGLAGEPRAPRKAAEPDVQEGDDE